MIQPNRYDIEHPANVWWQESYAVSINDEQKADIENRFERIDYDAQLVIDALANVTSSDHQHRENHERLNLERLGLSLPSDRRYHRDQSAVSPDQQLYETLAGNPDDVGTYAQWFSYKSHQAFVAQENLPQNKQFDRVSLGIGGKRQFGNWEVTGSVDDMIRSLPEQIVQKEPKAFVTVYGAPRKSIQKLPRVAYVAEGPKSYALFPRIDLTCKTQQSAEYNYEFSMAMLRRRRPVADITIEGQSDVVVFKESIGLLVIDLLNPGLRQRIYDDTIPKLSGGRNINKVVKFQDTKAARIGGAVFERAIRSPMGETIEIFPASAHYVQGVGERYAQFRQMI